MSAFRAPTPDAGYDNGGPWLRAVPDNPGLTGPDWGETSDLPQRHQAPALRDVNSLQRQPGNGWQETTGYRDETGPFAPGRAPAYEHFQDGSHSGRHSLYTSGQALMLADGRAAHIVQEAQDYAASIYESAEREAAAIAEQATGWADTMRENAEREAATIRETAQREAATITQQAHGEAATMREVAARETAELQARLDSMSGELSRVAAYVTETLIAPAAPATAPAFPEATPASPGSRSAPPITTPTKPASRPKPAGKPTKTATAPDTSPAGPAKPRTTPAKKTQTAGRQARAMRAITYATAGMLAFAAIAGATEIVEHGFSFFTFREGGVGETPGGVTDQQFEAHLVNVRGDPLAKAHPAAHPATAPKGKHHKTSP